MSEERQLRIVIVVGSVRPGNYTAKAASIVADVCPRIQLEQLLREGTA